MRFFLPFNKVRASSENSGAMTTSQKRECISAAVLRSIGLLAINTPPNAEIGSPARASL